MRITIVGGGAGGFFAAIQAKEKHPNAEVQILEKTKKVLSKVRISGGGRCNVTNACESINELSLAYPRGGRQLRKLFGKFNNHHMMDWLKSKGVDLKIYPDKCVFPELNDSKVIIDLFMNECTRLGIKINYEQHIIGLEKDDNSYVLKTKSGKNIPTDKIIFALGGFPKKSSFQLFEDLGYKIESPVPSLFTFNMPHENTADIMGIVVEDAVAKIEGEKLEGKGPLLFTHWGMSGPAILMLSAWGARVLEERDYKFNVRINWLADAKEDDVRKMIVQKQESDPQKIIKNQNPFSLPNRLWIALLNKLEISPESKWIDLGKKSINKLLNIIINDSYQVEGKTTFKEEFVTCGGISLDNLNMKTMESKIHPGVYFIGEMTDIDGITGGYNFQACWTTAWTAANAIF
jgi:predicted Rossmann fold flavoprotein